MQSKDETE
jgi:hypothetical protein